MRSSRVLLLCVAAAAHAAGAGEAFADPWPERAITLINPSAAGGSNETVKAIVFDRVATALGRPIVMESRAGAGGSIAAAITARAAPDGYTLLLGTSGALTTNPVMQVGVTYDPVRDFTPIVTVIEVPLFLVVTQSVQASNAGELIELLRREPGRYDYGSWGQGTQNFMAFELLKRLTGTDVLHVPYKGGAPLLRAMLGAEVQMAFMDLPTLAPHLEAGSLRILGIAGSSRLPVLPDVPTLLEQGIGITAAGYLILAGPAGLPAAIADRLNAEVVRVLSEPDVRRRLLEQGSLAVGGTREEAANRIATDLARWRTLVREMGYRPQ